MGSPQELEGNRWSVILAETCFVCLEIVLKVFVGFVWGFFFIQCTEGLQKLCFSVVLHSILKGFSQAHVPGAFYFCVMYYFIFLLIFVFLSFYPTGT